MTRLSVVRSGIPSKTILMVSASVLSGGLKPETDQRRSGFRSAGRLSRPGSRSLTYFRTSAIGVSDPKFMARFSSSLALIAWFRFSSPGIVLITRGLRAGPGPKAGSTMGGFCLDDVGDLAVAKPALGLGEAILGVEDGELRPSAGLREPLRHLDLHS